MKKFTLYVGLNDQKTKRQEIKTSQAKKIISDLLLKKYALEGATLSLVNGIYKHKNGVIVTEKTFKIELIYIEKNVVNSIINDLKKLLNQESIMLTIQELEIEFC